MRILIYLPYLIFLYFGVGLADRLKSCRPAQQVARQKDTRFCSAILLCLGCLGRPESGGGQLLTLLVFQDSVSCPRMGTQV